MSVDKNILRKFYCIPCKFLSVKILENSQEFFKFAVVQSMKKTERGTMEELSFKQLCYLFCCPPCNGFKREFS